MSSVQPVAPIAPIAPASTAQRVLLDTGFLVALYDARDEHHEAACLWLRRFQGCFVTTTQVITEAAYFLRAQDRAHLLDQTAAGWLVMESTDATAHARMAALLRKYADSEPDLADVSLVWLAEHSGLRSILTVDINDFSTYRISGRTRFDIIGWQR